jgi:GT2 family glycosyltransferase/2-polyprenyl-3-methyl-5-hydroxy-6-metoxy-1,4-benzoquinol methylase
MNTLLSNLSYKKDPSSNVWTRPEFNGIAYNDGDTVEQRIATIISEATDLSVLSTELRKHCTDWPSLYHLTGTRANILRPFKDILPNANVLEIGAGCGAITRYLGESGANVLALEGSPRRAAIARSRTRDLQNVTVLCDKFEQFKPKYRFDVITLIGVLEYANLFTTDANPPLAMLRQVRSLLKPDGKLIIAIENQFGLKYFAGAPEDHLGQPMYGIEGRYRKDQPQTFGRKVLERLLIEAGFPKLQFMAPFPDYKMPVSIITEAGLEAEDFDAAALAWQSVRRDPQLPQLLAFSPELAWPGIFENALALDLANSFLIIASSDNAHLVPPGVLAYHYSTDRRPEFCKETSFVKKCNDNTKVVCRLLSSAVPPQNSALTLFRPEVESDYVLGTPLSCEFIQIVTHDGWRFDDVANYFKRYLDILSRLTTFSGEQIAVASPDRDGHVRGRFIDAIPQNIVCMPNGTYQLIDTEWQGTADVPVGRLLFRSILWQLFGVTRFGQPAETMQSITRHHFIVEIFSRLGMDESIVDFSEFLRAESEFQEMVTGRSADQFMEWWPNTTLPIENLNLAVIRSTSQIAERDQQIAERDQQIAERDQQIAAILNSKSWRITRPLRKVTVQCKKIVRLYRMPSSLVKRHGGFRLTAKKAQQIIKNEGLAGIKRRLQGQLVGRGKNLIELDDKTLVDRNDYAEWIRRYDTLDDAARVRIKQKIESFERTPLISVVMPVYDPPLNFLDEAIWSVRNQLYPHWEFCIADDASKNQAVRDLLIRHANEDSRIKLVFRKTNGHISAASNSALDLATGEFVALLDNDDLLPEHALFWVAKTILENPDAGLIYSDEDKINESGNRYAPYFKCDYNYELLLAQNMICHLGVYRRNLLEAVGGFRSGLEGAQDYDLALRVVELLPSTQINHIPRILYHWRAITGSTALAGDEKNYAAIAGRKAVSEHLQRRGLQAEVVPAPEAPGLNRVRLALPSPTPLVSIIIPTRDRSDILATCVKSILSFSTYPAFEIIIVDNGSVETATLDLFKSLSSDKIRIVRDDFPFNFSRLNNIGVKESQGTILCLLNNDIEIVSPGWLEELVAFACQEDVGCVGARLWYPDGRLQHGGVILGIGGVAGHSHKFLTAGEAGFFGRAVLQQSISAVTAACLVIRRSIYDEVGGLDDTFPVAFNDIDFCLRVREAGFRNIWTPYAEMVHHESVSRGPEDSPEKQARFNKEVRKMLTRWGDILQNDLAYSPNLTLDHEDFSLAWPPRVENL